MTQLKWQRCGKGQDQHWCNFLSLNLESVKTQRGVYVIWHEAGIDTDGFQVERKAVRVGQSDTGSIADRLQAHCSDDEVLSYEDLELKVTCAKVSDREDLNGIEKFLGDFYDPLVPCSGARFPDVEPIPVNVPW